MSSDPRLLDDLVARGLVHDTTDRRALAARLAQGPVTVYCGFDPTADSLHAGHLMGLLALRRFQLAGHRPIPLAGGATGMIGDPSGRSAERSLLDDDTLAANLAGIVPQLRQFLDFEGVPNPAKLLDNRAWTVSLSVLDFLRDVGKHVTVGQMLGKESVRARMAGEEGISYTEFSYMLLQAHDFAWLFAHEGCELQVGGSDQWGNISLGVDLVRRRHAATAHGLTWPLLTRKDGSKYGKTASGDNIWLGAHRMSPYRFYQAWLQVDDDEVPKLLRQLTFCSLAEVDEVVAAHRQAPQRRIGQRRLAGELTTLVHGPAATATAVAASEAVFGGPVAALDARSLQMLEDEVPTARVSRDRLDEGGTLVPLLAEVGVVGSKSEALRLVDQGGLSVNDRRLGPGEDPVVGRHLLLHDRWLVVRRGRRQVHLLSFSDGV